MDQEIYEIKEQFTHSFFQIRQIISMIHATANAHMKQYGVSTAEVSLMKMVKGNTADADDNISSQDIQNRLCVSKGAVSKILSSLEQKDYLVREISHQNRRFQIITLTPAGQELLAQLEIVANKVFTALIEKMGRKNAEQFAIGAHQLTDAARSILAMCQTDDLLEE